MRKLPRRLGRFSALGPRTPYPGDQSRVPSAPEGASDEDDLAVSAARGSATSKSTPRTPYEPTGVPVDAAIEAALAVPGIDAVTRLHFDEARGRLAARRTEATDVLDGPTLSDALFTFVMPRLQHPEVLGVENQLVLLEQLAGELSGQDGDTVIREGALAVHRELRRLALLRLHCSSLVEG